MDDQDLIKSWRIVIMTVEFIALISLTLSYDEKIEYDNRKKKNDIEGNNRLYFAL